MTNTIQNLIEAILAHRDVSVHITRAGECYSLVVTDARMGVDSLYENQSLDALLTEALADLNGEHAHRGDESKVIGLSWGTRTIETCACGAYRTFDVPRDAALIVLGQDHQWSNWTRLESTERDS